MTSREMHAGVAESPKQANQMFGVQLGTPRNEQAELRQAVADMRKAIERIISNLNDNIAEVGDELARLERIINK